jgi:hypothetical protein
VNLPETITAVEVTPGSRSGEGRVAPIAPDSDWISLQLKGDCHDHLNQDWFVAGTVE